MPVCADRLVSDLKRMETGYLDQHKREYETTKQISLASLDPLALVKLRATGSCDFSVPEALFDLDHPGQYFRRIKTVSISMPCVAGPNTSISAKLSLTSNRYRKDLRPDNLALTGYSEDPGNDERFVYNLGTIQSIATSAARRTAACLTSTSAMNDTSARPSWPKRSHLKLAGRFLRSNEKTRIPTKWLPVIKRPMTGRARPTSSAAVLHRYRLVNLLGFGLSQTSGGETKAMAKKEQGLA
jgi:hypothetical protein